MLRCGSIVLAAVALAAPVPAAAQTAPVGAPLEIADVALRHGTSWQVHRDAATRVARVASGPALHLLALPAPTAAEVDAALRDFADAHVELIGAPAAELGPAHQRQHPDGRRVVSYQQHVGGDPVVGAWIHFQLQGARLLTFASTAVPAPTSLPPRRLDAAEARSVAWSHLVEQDASPERVVTAPAQVLVPRDGAAGPVLRPAWRVAIDSRRTGAREQLFVDAETGAVLRRVDARAHAGVRVVAEVDRPDGQEGTTTLPMPHASGAAGVTDADGRIEVDGERFALGLAGPRAEIVDHAAAVQAAELTADALPADALGTATWPSSAPLEQRSAWVFIHRAIEHGLQNAPGLGFLDQPLPVNLNFGDSDFPYCNAFYMPRNYVEAGERPATYFYAEGGGTIPGSDTTLYCYNTGRLFKVVAHEWGHGFHDHLLPAGLGIERDERSISEGVGDYVAFTLTESTTIISEITRPDSPNQYPGRSAINSLRYPDDLRSYDRGDGVLVDDVHHNGQIWSGSWWDLRALLGDLHGPSGIRHADRLHAATLRGAPTFESAYELAIAADDDDGDPSNGTPHACLITAAFARHGLAPAPRPSQGAIRYGHDPVEAAAAGQPIEIAAIVDPLQGCGPLDPGSVTLSFAVDGGGFEDVPMQLADGHYRAIIPPQPDGALVRYAIGARTTDAEARTWSTPGDGTFHAVRVGTFQPAVLWDFEDGGVDWTHGSDDALITDDWEIGAPTGRGLAANRAVSGRAIAGTDLGSGGGNGLYAPNVSRTWLESPAFDCRGCERLQFRRWLRLGAGDRARVLVGDEVVWDSAGDLVADDDWTLVDIDLRDLALDGPVTVRFELSSDAQSVAAGWNLDDVALFAASGGGDLAGGCASSGGGSGGLAALAFAALLLRLRRRRPVL